MELKLIKVKKCSILVIFVICIILLLTNKYWLIFNPLHVSLNIKGSGICCIEAILNKKDSNEFEKTKSEIIEINLDEKNQADLYIYSSRFQKRIQFIIFTTKTNNNIILSKIKVGKFNIENLNKFDIIGADFYINNDMLILKPKNGSITLTYSEKLKTGTDIKFDFKIFIIILVLTYFFIYKIANYIVDFNILYRKSKIDILFLTIFFIFLFIPISYINQEEISKQENRSFAKWMPLIKENSEINFDFGKNFNNWFNDRFFLRNEFVNTYYRILSCFSKDYYESREIIYNKKADFSFNKGYNSVNIYLKKDLFTKQELKTIYKNILNLKNYCEKHNVKFYIILSNDKESIYPEYYPKYYKPNNNISRLEQVKELLKTIPNLNVISPYKNLIKEKENNMVFLHYDTHLNAIGTYTEYSTIISELQKLYSNINLIEFSQIKIVKTKAKIDSCPPEKYINKNYEYIEEAALTNSSAKINNKLKILPRLYFFHKYLNNKSDNNLKVVIVGDSFHTIYMHLLAENFYSLNSLFVGDGKNFILDKTSKEILFAEKPDILFIETTERFLQRLLELDSFFDIFDSKYRSN